MTCEDASTLLHGYADGELDLVKSLEVEAHLRGCADCARARTSLRALRMAFADGALYHEAPPWLEHRVRAAVSDARRAGPRRSFALGRFAWAGAAAAAIVLIALAARGILRFGQPASDLIARQAVDDHLRSLMANHLTDVLSSNQHTVKPWFDGRLNFTPPVKDLGAQGFPLVGGRLDYLDNRPVAAMVYRRREHMINLFIAPAEHAADTPPRSQVRAGYNVVHWIESGMTYWAVSSVSGAELEKFVQLVRQETPKPSTPRPMNTSG